MRALRQFFARCWSLLGQIFEETETVTYARQGRYGQRGGISRLS